VASGDRVLDTLGRRARIMSLFAAFVKKRCGSNLKMTQDQLLMRLTIVARGKMPDLDHYRRTVTLRREGEMFVITLHPENSFAFRSEDAEKLRRTCSFLHWKIISDAARDEEKDWPERNGI
jgi:hypothetical protein